MKNKNAEVFKYALVHLERERAVIEDRIGRIRQQLGITETQVTPPAKEEMPRKKRTLSAAARKRIAAAQKKRWEKIRRLEQKGIASGKVARLPKQRKVA